MRRIFLLLVSAAVLLVTASCGGDVTTEATPASTSIKTLETPTAEPTPHQFAVFGPEAGYATASLEERIYTSDIVVRAYVLTASGGVVHFSAAEYLKGNGPSEFAVPSEHAAVPGVEAVLFLNAVSPPPSGTSTLQIQGQSSPGTPSYSFEDSDAELREYAGNRPDGYGPASNNPVWLPVQTLAASPPQSGNATSTPADNSVIVTDVVQAGPTPCSTDEWPQNDPDCADTIKASTDTISLSDLRTKINWVEANNDNDAYSRCVHISLRSIRDSRDWKAYYGQRRDFNELDVAIDSGAAAGEVIVDYGGTGWGAGSSSYDKVWLEGRDTALFKSSIVDNDSDPSNGFASNVTTLRPLPASSYQITSRLQPHWLNPCNFASDLNGLHVNVVVTAPEGTVHEAFFDPATTTDGIGYVTSTGVLEPAAFGGGVITTLTWQNGNVRVVTNPAGALASTTLDFIALDGSTALSLDPDVATSTSTGAALTWDVSPAPWKAGDQLMLRVTKDPSPPIFDARLTIGRLSYFNEPGYLRGIEGALTPEGFEFDGRTVRVAAFYWTKEQMKFLTENYADLSGHVITVLNSEDAEILRLAIDDARALVRGSNYIWNVPEQPWRVGDTVRMVIRLAE